MYNMDKLKKIYNCYMQSKLLRNISALFIDFIIIFLAGYSVYFCFTLNTNNINWYILLSAFIAIIILRRLSYRLWVVQVCPQCFQNRGIGVYTSKTGNTSNYQKFVKGDYWYYAQDVEYLRTTKCCFCTYEENDLYWSEETWQGDLTEEAKLRRAAEVRSREIEHERMAQTQARIDAWERIQQRRRY